MLTERTIGAFATTNLHELLQASAIRRIVVAGVATSGTVLSTTRWAFDIGYEVTVCADACGDPDPQAHTALLNESVYPQSWLGLWRIAHVLHSAQIPELQPAAG
ncbi:hypothetical protein BCD48_41195 [Pseudofrankia sp. BMG5.36]|nr:hypothetical protein BCD48_41195 [Pseudofrankia sp. BMG5.36]